MQLSDLRKLKALKNREELENLNLNTTNALFNEKDQFLDLNELGEPITKIQTVKLRINGFMFDSKFNKGDKKLWLKFVDLKNRF